MRPRALLLAAVLTLVLAPSAGAEPVSARSIPAASFLAPLLPLPSSLLFMSAIMVWRERPR